ncbi:hypothetical protein CU097_000877, partial [Rhizopus azygosporus]
MSMPDASINAVEACFEIEIVGILSPELAQAASDIATHLNTVSKLISEHVEGFVQAEQVQQ